MGGTESRFALRGYNIDDLNTVGLNYIGGVGCESFENDE
jgi:hypothetical protein